MKKHLFLLIAVACTLNMLNAQNTVPNGSFENWVSTTYELPTNYLFSSVTESFYRGITPNVERSNDAYQGQYSIKLTTVKSTTDTIGAWFANSSDTKGEEPSTWGGGIPYNQIPTGFRGYYKYNVATQDSALVGFVFKKNGKSFAHYYFTVGGNYSNYNLFEYTFNPPLTQAPDSIIFIATSSNLLKFNGIPGSTLILDNVSLTGVSSQPNLLNGDFEAWTSHATNLKPSGWNSYDVENNGILRCNEAYDGTYALELRTYQGSNENNQPIAENGWIQIGEYFNQSTFLGGFPFNQAHDKLVFYYKYAPQNINDKASINLIVKRNGMWVGGNGMQLDASASYKYAELNINTFDDLVPDSAYISISSSDWEHMDLSYIGASLKIDKLTFLSHIQQVEGYSISENAITLSPNPLKISGELYIQPETDITGAQLHIYSVLGASVRLQPVISHKTIVNKDNLLPGTYLWEVTRGDVVLKKGKLVVE